MGALKPIYKRGFLSDRIRFSHASNWAPAPLSSLRAFEAADELSATPAAISHQIAALEADLGVSLFRQRN
jgi:hypothetical protein